MYNFNHMYSGLDVDMAVAKSILHAQFEILHGLLCICVYVCIGLFIQEVSSEYYN